MHDGAEMVLYDLKSRLLNSIPTQWLPSQFNTRLSGIGTSNMTMVSGTGTVVRFEA
jgi:hypothetical protein